MSGTTNNTTTKRKKSISCSSTRARNKKQNIPEITAFSVTPRYNTRAQKRDVEVNQGQNIMNMSPSKRNMKRKVQQQQLQVQSVASNLMGENIVSGRKQKRKYRKKIAAKTPERSLSSSSSSCMSDSIVFSAFSPMKTMPPQKDLYFGKRVTRSVAKAKPTLYQTRLNLCLNDQYERSCCLSRNGRNDSESSNNSRDEFSLKSAPLVKKQNENKKVNKPKLHRKSRTLLNGEYQVESRVSSQDFHRNDDDNRQKRKKRKHSVNRQKHYKPEVILPYDDNEEFIADLQQKIKENQQIEQADESFNKSSEFDINQVDILIQLGNQKKKRIQQAKGTGILNQNIDPILQTEQSISVKQIRKIASSEEGDLIQVKSEQEQSERRSRSCSRSKYSISSYTDSEGRYTSSVNKSRTIINSIHQQSKSNFNQTENEQDFTPLIIQNVQTENKVRLSDLTQNQILDLKQDCLKAILQSLTSADITQQMLCCRKKQRQWIERIIFKHLFADVDDKSLMDDDEFKNDEQKGDNDDNLHQFVYIKGIDMTKGDFVYICGQPGTGKTTMMRSILQQVITRKRNFKSMFINIMAFGRASSIISHIIQNLEIKLQKMGLNQCILRSLDSDVFAQILRHYIKLYNIEKLVFVFDEIDQYSATNNLQNFTQLISNILTIPEITVVGIANSIDFLQFQHCGGFSKTKIVFEAYNKQQLEEIVNARVYYALEPFALHLGISNQELTLRVFERSALRFCTLKLSKMSPDLRKVIEITIDAVNRALVRLHQFKTKLEFSIDVVKTQTDQIYQDESKQGQDTKQTQQQQQIDSILVTITDFQSAMSAKFESRVRKIIATLPKGRIILIKSIIDSFSSGKNKTVDEIFIMYNKLLNRLALQRASYQQMMDGLVALEFYGIVSLKSMKNRKTANKSSYQKGKQVVFLQCDIEELELAIAEFGGFIATSIQLKLKQQKEQRDIERMITLH